VPSGNGAARDGNEEEREHSARPNRSAAVDELGDGGHLEIGTNDNDANGQEQDGADLQECRKIIARGEKQPDRQYGCDETVADDDQRERLPL
jgi:hypothetical protein